MVKIEFVGGISKELAAVMEERNIPCTCIEGNVCEMTEDAYEELYQRARAALDGNDAVVIEHYESKLSLAITTLEDLERYYNEGCEPNHDKWANEAQLAIERNGWASGCGETLTVSGKDYAIICSDEHRHLVCDHYRCFIY